MRAPRKRAMPAFVAKASRWREWAQPLLRLSRRVPRAAWICALVASLNAACWSFITPPFQVPDEPSHFAYVQWLAENGTLPTTDTSEWSQEEKVALSDLHQPEVRFSPAQHPIATKGDQTRLERDFAKPLSRMSQGAAGVAASQPPLYYALQTIPYGVASGGTILDRLELMRLLSALIAGVAALFGCLFVREVLVGPSSAWAVGGLGIALFPLLGFMSGAVNPEVLLVAVSAAAFFCLARAFRSGLTPTLAVATGTLVALGSLTKLNFIGLAPGIILGLLLLSLREARTSRRAAFRALAVALAIAAAPACVYILINVARSHAALGSVSQVSHPTGSHGSLLGEVSYIWQFYLPRLPGMTTDFPGISPLRDVWFNRTIGLYGWLDTPFPNWVYTLALVPAALLTALAIRALFARRSYLSHRLGEVAVYASMVGGLLVLTGAASYLSFPAQAGKYGEPRYLLPLIPLVGLALALSTRGAGRRWELAVGVLVVVLFLGWDVASQLQVIARYYG
jgi:4-amino-4-deoxy-L-arabinose transferase-like glycosyltransferase